MKHATACLAVLMIWGCAKNVNNSGSLLVTGKSISPPTDHAQDLGSLPMNMILSPNGEFAITSDMGYRQSLWSVRVSDGAGMSHVDFPNLAEKGGKARGGAESRGAKTSESAVAMGGGVQKANGLYYGLAISREGIVYAAQGGLDRIAVLELADNGELKMRESIATQKHDFPAGLALDERGMLYVANNAAAFDDPYKLIGSVAIYDTRTKAEVGRFAFSSSFGGTSNFPFGIATLKAGEKTYVASERDNKIYVLDTNAAHHPTLKASIEVGAHPAAVLLSRDQKRLFVANTLSDTISIIDTTSDSVISTILLRPVMARDLPGVSPTAMALSPNQKTLYVTLGDMNAVAVIDLPTATVRGYMPTGWYPSAIASTPDGKSLLVVNAKGNRARTPNNRSDPYDPARKNASMLTLLEGNVGRMTIPADAALEKLTQQVLSENRLDRLQSPAPNPLAGIGIQAGGIQHVIYIVKENRTYDQVLGDMPQGNGDKSLVLFGNDVTPNLHALAERFVLLDNLYACGEVSGDGWDWSTQGMADAYVIRNIPYNYSHRGRAYDFEGTNNTYPTGGAPARDASGKQPATHPSFKNGSPSIPDVANTGRNIWDTAVEAGASIRNYGFWVYLDDNIAGTPGGPNNYPMSARLQPGGRDLTGITDLDYRGFDMNFPDSDAPSVYFKQTGDKRYLFPKTTFGMSGVPSRYSEWNREFQIMLKNDPTGRSVPAFTMIRLPTDHTVAATSGKHAPVAYLADNDYALGQIVQSVSHSVIWTHTAIVVIEDDAQSGADHVDGHRTIGFVISPFIKAHSVDHRFYNTDSMLKTIELLLGAKPLSQYDAVADPIMDWDTSPSNNPAYNAILPAKEIMIQINPKAAALAKNDPRYEMARDSDAMDFIHADAAPTEKLNEIVWRSVRGVNSVMPSPRGIGKDDDDD